MGFITVKKASEALKVSKNTVNNRIKRLTPVQRAQFIKLGTRGKQSITLIDEQALPLLNGITGTEYEGNEAGTAPAERVAEKSAPGDYISIEQYKMLEALTEELRAQIAELKGDKQRLIEDKEALQADKALLMQEKSYYIKRLAITEASTASEPVPSSEGQADKPKKKHFWQK